jgi:DNA-binding SARP family transcriptional activator
MVAIDLDRALGAPWLAEVAFRPLPWPAATRCASRPIRAFTLGRFDLCVEGTVFRLSAKTQHRPLVLLKVLVARGPQPVSCNGLIDALWPGPDARGGQKALEVTVHRLRRLLKRDGAIIVHDRCVALDPSLVWSDLWALESLLAPFAPLACGGPIDPASLERQCEGALALYLGPFLPAEGDAPWVLEVRDRIHGRFRRFVELLGREWERQRRWALAAQLYERATELDPVAEPFYLRRMECLAAMGRRTEALDTYRRCRKMLSVVLGVRPQGATEDALRRLLGTTIE